MNELYTKLFNLRDSIKEDSQKDKNRVDNIFECYNVNITVKKSRQLSSD